MLNVLVVDDEYYAREGIKSMLRSGVSDAVANIHEAKNALEALELCKTREVELVITDIKMPHMDGLDMIETLQSIRPGLHFICITGHDDFAYAHRSLKLQVVDFLLKPVNPQELAQAVQRALQAIERHTLQEKHSTERALVALLESEPLHAPVDPLLAKKLQAPMAIALWCCPTGPCTEAETCLQAAGQSSWFIHDAGKDTTLYCIYSAPEAVQQVRLALAQQLATTPGAAAAFVVFTTHEAIAGGLHRAHALLEDAFYLEAPALMETPIRPVQPLDEARLACSARAFAEALHSQQRGVAQAAATELFGLFFAMKIPREALQKQLLKLFFHIREPLFKRGIAVDTEHQAGHILNAPSLAAAQQLFGQYMEGVYETLQEYEYSAEESPVVWAIRYIEQNYTQDISLESLAQMAHINSSYLSRSIKERLGMSYSRYTLKLRMENAASLLQQGQTVQQVAQSIGYGNYRSFSTGFKSYYGCSPREYQRAGKEGETP